MLFQLPLPQTPGRIRLPRLPPGEKSATEGGVNSGPVTKWLTAATASACIAGVNAVNSASVTSVGLTGGNCVENGWVGDVCSPGTVDCGTGISTIGQIASPVLRSST